MKNIFTALIAATTILCLHAQAEPNTNNSAAFQASIMAFGVPADIAQQAAKTAIDDIEKQHTNKSEKNALESAFANISDDLVNDPYGF